MDSGEIASDRFASEVLRKSHDGSHSRTRQDETTNKTGRVKSIPSLHALSLVHRDCSEPRRTGVENLLPLELWQHVFTYLDPSSLGRLLCICSAFNTLLDPEKMLPKHTGTNVVSLRPQNDIWSQSRRRWTSGTPRPLQGQTELEMWRLIRGSNCQYCGEASRACPSSGSSDPWTAGPGSTGCRVIWAFGVRSCAACLRPQLVKVRSTTRALFRW